MKITYFVHGTTTDNETGRATGWLPGKLSAVGIEQSKALPGMVTDTSFSVVISSDLQRAKDTARLAFGKTHQLRSDKRLREANYGAYNGKEHTFKDSMADFISEPFPHGESYMDTEARMRDFLSDCKAEGLEHIAIVAHEAPQLALEVIANGKSWSEAIENNWRKTKNWKPGWIYEV